MQMNKKYASPLRTPVFVFSVAILSLQVHVAEAQTQAEIDNLNRFVEEVDYSFKDTEYFSERIDPYSGTLVISHRDLFIPGNGGLDLEIIRHYLTPGEAPGQYDRNQAEYHMGYGWDIHFGYIKRGGWNDRSSFELWNSSVILGNNTSNRFSTCYKQGEYVVRGGLNAGWDSMTLVMQDGNSEYLANAISTEYAFVTKSGWRGGCAVNGYILYSPEGLKYTFDQDKYTASSTRLGDTTYGYAWYVSRIEDKYGNWISINYASSEQALIDTVTTSDGRTIDFIYTTLGGHPRLTRISANGQSIDYAYDANQNLARVQIGTRVLWRYTYEPWFYWLVESTYYLLKTLTTESGGVIEYTNAQQGPVYTEETPPTVVTRRKTSGTLPQSETSYGYGFVYTPELGHVVVNTIRESDRCTKNYFGSAWISPWLTGTLLRTEVYRNPDCTNLIQTTEYEWAQVEISTGGVHREFYRRFIGKVHTVEDASYWKAVMTRKTLTRDGGTYTTTYSNFTPFGQPRIIVENNPLGETRTIRYTYVNSPYQYGLELLSSSIIESASGQIVSETSIQFNSIYEPITRTNNGISTFYSYHSNGNIHTIADGEGNVTTLSNYYRGQARLIADAVGVKARTIDYFGNVTGVTDELNNTTTFAYESFDRLSSITPPIGAPIDYTYTENRVVVNYGNYVKRTDLDGFGRTLLITEQDAVRGLTRYRNFEYDTHERLAFASIVSGIPTETDGTSYEYDDLDRMTRTITPLGELTYQYPTAGEMRQTDGRGNQVIVTYGGYGSPDYTDTRQMQYNSSSGVITVGLDKDEAGRIRLVSQGGHTIAYDYHDTYRDLVDLQVYPQLTVYLDYDAAGNMISKKVNGSDKTFFDYDSRNRLIAKDYPSGTSDVQYTYYPTNQLNKAENGWGDWIFEYDDNRNPTVRSLATNDKTFRFEYDYDPQNNLRGITYPSGLQVDYAPNAFGQATKAGIYANNVLHHPQGSMRSLSYGNGLTYQLMLAPNKALIGDIVGKSAGVNVIHKSYVYDSEINVTSIIDHINAQYSVSQFEYDQINRLTKASSASWGGLISIGYDKLGNITSQVLPTGTKTYTYDGSNQLMLIAGLDPQTFDYDLYGNVRNNARHSFIYNDAAQLISATSAVHDNVYVYDALGKRIQVIDAEGNITYEVHDSSDKLLLVEEPSGVLKHKIYLGNKLIAQDRGGSIQYMHFDTLGSTIAVSDQSRQLTLEHYRPYGDKVENPQGSGNNQWYTGKPFDADIALSYYGARYYDPAVGRFYSADPVGFTGVHSFNRYAYANNNPYKYIDPDGRETGRTFKLLNELANGGKPIVPPPRSPDDWVGPAIGYALAGMLVAPVAGELYFVALSNPGTVATATEIAAEVAGVTGVASVGAAAARGINITERGLAHVLARHTVGGARTASKSVFNSGEDVVALVRNASDVPRVPQARGAFERVVDAGRTIGVDRATSQPTSVYTVITNAEDDLITAFPGRP